MVGKTSKAFTVALIQKQSPEVFCKKWVLNNFTKFRGKHLCQSFFFNKKRESGQLVLPR